MAKSDLRNMKSHARGAEREYQDAYSAGMAGGDAPDFDASESVYAAYEQGLEDRRNQRIERTAQRKESFASGGGKGKSAPPTDDKGNGAAKKGGIGSLVLAAGLGVYVLAFNHYHHVPPVAQPPTAECAAAVQGNAWIVAMDGSTPIVCGAAQPVTYQQTVTAWEHSVADPTHEQWPAKGQQPTN